MFITAELAVEDELIEALPATTWPLVGRESLGKTGTAGFAKTIDEETVVVIKITRAK